MQEYECQRPASSPSPTTTAEPAEPAAPPPERNGDPAPPDANGQPQPGPAAEAQQAAAQAADVPAADSPAGEALARDGPDAQVEPAEPDEPAALVEPGEPAASEPDEHDADELASAIAAAALARDDAEPDEGEPQPDRSPCPDPNPTGIEPHPSKRMLDMATHSGGAVRRFTPDSPCPICDGCESDRRGTGERCYGYLSSDGEYAYCTREEYAGGLAEGGASGAFPHRLHGPCRCGKTHGDELPRPRASKTPAGSRNGSNGKKPLTKHPTLDRAVEAALWSLHKTDTTYRAVARWGYFYADGRPAFVMIRFQTAAGVKTYRPIHMTEHRGFMLGDPPGLLPLYRLRELLAADVADPVWFSEGEKSSDLIANLKLTATSAAHGAKSPELSDFSPLAGRDVIIIPDCDKPGRQYAQTVAAIVTALDPPARVKILELGLQTEGDDIEQWLAGLPAEWTPEQRRAELQRLAAEAPAWSPPVGGNENKPEPAATTVDPAALAAQISTWATNSEFKAADLYGESAFLAALARIEQVGGGEAAKLMEAVRDLPGIKPTLLTTALKPHKAAAKIQAKAAKAAAAAVGEADGEDSGSGGVTYFVGKDGGFMMMTDEKTERLSNFWGQIVTEVVRDDGDEETRSYMVKVEHESGISKVVEVAAGDLNKGEWVSTKLGANYIVEFGQVSRAAFHLGSAILHHSEGFKEKRIFTHLGWRRLGNENAFLHCSGAITADGNDPSIKVEPDGLSGFRLPDPPTGDDLVRAIRATLRFLDLAQPRRKGSRPLAAIGSALPVRAVLGPVPFTVMFAGLTGKLKTSTAATIQQRFGSNFSEHHLPGSWLNTANANESLLHDGKDVLVTLDDFKPSGTVVDQAQSHKDIERIVRAQGNIQGRRRMRPDGTLAPATEPRGALLITGEDVPREKSIRARMLIVWFTADTVDSKLLRRCQDDADDGIYAAAMAGFLRWMAPQLDEVRTEHAAKVKELRPFTTAEGDHGRIKDQVAELMAAWQIFLRFASEVNAIDEADGDHYYDFVWDGLRELVADSRDDEPAAAPNKFLALLAAALAAHEGYLTDTQTGDAPAGMEAQCGWKLVDKYVGPGGGPSPLAKRWETGPNQKQVGATDGTLVYLNPPAAYAAVLNLGRSTNEPFTVSQSTLRRQLNDAGLLIVDPRTDRKRLSSRAWIPDRESGMKKQQTVLTLRVADLWPKPVDPEQMVCGQPDPVDEEDRWEP
jgi:hypothetical protein